jgi:hypothetical protein
MGIELRWLISTPASTLHAAAAMLDGRTLTDRKTAEAIGPEVGQLGIDLASVGIDRARFFEHAIPASTQLQAPAALAKVVAAKILSPSAADGAAPRLGRRLIALFAAFANANLDSLDELELRSKPLSEQWDARGPGLMAALGRVVQEDLLVDAADVILVQPVLGGSGAAHPLYNSVRIEAVLANPIPELPEVARLGWLLSQLKLDLPKYQGNLPSGRMAHVGPLAMIPPALVAAQEVELVRFDSGVLATALRAWTSAVVEADKLMDWWETYQADRPSWGVAIGALDQMLDAEPLGDNAAQN